MKKTARKVRKDINVKLLIIVASLLAVVLVFAGVFACNHFITKANSVIADNVYVNSINVGGLTVDQAKAKIEESISPEYFDKTVSIKYMDELFEINLRDAVSVNFEETAKSALSVPKGNGKQVVPFKLNINSDNAKTEILKQILHRENRLNVFTFNEDYTLVNVDAPKANEILDIDKTLSQIFENAKNDIYDEIGPVFIKYGDDGFDEALYMRLSRPAINATVGMNEDKSTYIIPEIVGITADKDTFLKLYSSTGGIFQMEVEPIFPEITTADLDIEFYQDVLGEYTSKYNGNLVNRTKNVSLAAGFVNGTIIMPGQTFSYNRVVGKRTAERGFREATVYTGEGTEEGLGGGICQVSSTIYCAQLRANLKTVSRTNHSYTVVYVPLGQDATVSYGALDYVFENDTNYPIKIETVMGGGRLTVRILGTKVDKSLTYDIVSVTNSTIAKKEITKEDPSIPTGETKVKQSGQSGAVVSTYRVHYKDGVEIKREYIGKSTYVPMNRIVLVGTGEPLTDEPVTDDENTENPENPDIVTGEENGSESVPENPGEVVEPSIPEDGEDIPADGNDVTTEPEEPSTSDTGL